jgi:uncharacterized membrane protein (UPF0182 family)
MMRKRFSLIVVLLALFLLLGGLSFAVDLYFDFLWFQELGKSIVFTTALVAQSLLTTLTLLVSFVFLYLNLLQANRGPGEIQLGIPTPAGQITAYVVTRQMVRKIAGLAALVVSFFLGVREAQKWETVWRWLNRVDFGISDPIFGRDVSFFFFSLPLMGEVVSLGIILCLLAGAGSAILYYFKGSLSLRNLSTRGHIRVHISLLLALFFLLLSANAYLDRFQVLYSSGGPMFGATYADLHGRLPLLNLQVLAAIVGALLLAYSAFASRNVAAIGAIGLYFAVALLGSVYPALLQKFVVAPNELGRETPQIEHNIRATLHAYGLQQVQERNLSGDKALSRQDIQDNAATIQSIRLWDHEPLLDAFSQIQEIRTYYDFATVDNDRYMLNGMSQQMMISPRELNSASLPERNWINEHLSYTHGYGVTLGPVNRVTREGLPVLLVQDIPPRAQETSLAITRPEIYYGELTKGYVIVKTSEKEFDYPSGEENVYASYKGEGGVPIRSFLRKLLFAVYFKDPNIVLSPMLKPDSRFLYFRDIRTRIQKVAPFLTLDQDPYIVVSGGKLYWIQDGYTTSDRYPYSTPLKGIGNYIRNSVKAVVDAYSGRVDLYVADAADPLIQVYQRIFPGVFRPIAEMPADLQRHVRYPEDIFRFQTFIYSMYHMTNPQIFYNKEDLWEVPVLSSGQAESAIAPYYTIMRLPQEQEKEEEFILMLPFTPNRKDNLSAWMVARSDAPNYGQLVVYRFPKQKLVYGPKQIVARINQDAEISRQVSLWDQRGSQVIQGTLLVIPIEEGLIYVRPLYLRAETGKIPELKRVIVAYENRIAMEETLEASIARIFGDQIPIPGEPAAAPAAGHVTEVAVPGGRNGLIIKARDAYGRAIEAQRAGDWARYGEELKNLGAILNELSKSEQSVPK